MPPLRLVFVCTGNICRSPAAHAVMAARLGSRTDVTLDSCGLGGWHAGELPDPRARAEGLRRRFVLDHPARQVRPGDFTPDTVLVAMAREHQTALGRLAPPGFPPARVVLLRDFDPACAPGTDVDDPYYGTDDDFARMFDVIEAAAPGLERALHRWRA